MSVYDDAMTAVNGMCFLSQMPFSHGCHGSLCCLVCVCVGVRACVRVCACVCAVVTNSISFVTHCSLRET
jgi:hypothetical protein